MNKLTSWWFNIKLERTRNKLRKKIAKREENNSREKKAIQNRRA